MLLAWLIYIPALYSEPGAACSDASDFKQQQIRPAVSWVSWRGRRGILNEGTFFVFFSCLTVTKEISSVPVCQDGGM